MSRAEGETHREPTTPVTRSPTWHGGSSRAHAHRARDVVGHRLVAVPATAFQTLKVKQWRAPFPTVECGQTLVAERPRRRLHTRGD